MTSDYVYLISSTERKIRQYIGRILLFLFACGGIYLSGCTQTDGEGGTPIANDSDVAFHPAEEGQVKVTFFDVGKGDAILIETLAHFMLIDSGYEDTADVLLDYMEEQSISCLDYLVLTHFDKDHVGGADWIINNLQVKEVLQPDYESDSGQYQEYEMAMGEGEMTPVMVTEIMEISFDGVDFLIIPPEKENYEEENDFSLVVSMVCGEKSFLFTGDCEKVRLDEFLEQNDFTLSHDILKIPHHGRKEKNSEEFLQAVQPSAAVITNLEEKAADGKVCRVLREMGTEVFFTGNGVITCLCDGKELQVIQEN